MNQRLALGGALGVITLLAACSGGAQTVVSESSLQPSSTSSGKNGAESNAPTASPSPEITLNISALGVTITDLPGRWNSAIAQYATGNQLPVRLNGTQSLPGYNSTQIDYPNGNYINVSWNVETDQVVGVSAGGFSDDASAATDAIANASAMTYATTDLSISEAENFIVRDLIGDSLENVIGSPEISEQIQQPDRLYRFDFFSNVIDFSVDGSIK